MRIQSNGGAPMTGSAGMFDDITNPATACRAGAVVIGATVVVGSVGLTTMVAPAVTLIPTAGAIGLWAVADKIRDDKMDANDAKSASETEPAAA